MENALAIIILLTRNVPALIIGIIIYAIVDYILKNKRSVTQRLEWKSYKFLVVGSTPTTPTTKGIKHV